VLADLRERLHRVHWPDEVPGAGWQYAPDLSYMQELAAYGRDRYDWRTQEPQLNRFQQYIVPLVAWRCTSSMSRAEAPARCHSCCHTAGRARSSSSSR
jgi:hypothetical protein